MTNLTGASSKVVDDEHLAAIAGPREPRAQIGILGDVEGIPGHQPFQRRDAEVV